MSLPELIHPTTDDELNACFHAFSFLRPHLKREAFVAQARRQQAQGYRIVAVRVGEAVPSAAGYRAAEFMAWGKVLYVDDLTTVPESRGRGYGSMLLDWLTAHARSLGCEALHLDSGYTRHAAHRLYLSKGLQLSSHHFVKKLA